MSHDFTGTREMHALNDDYVRLATVALGTLARPAFRDDVRTCLLSARVRENEETISIHRR
jgi:hypothetical protein